MCIFVIGWTGLKSLEVLSVTDLKVLYKVIAAYVSLPVYLPYIYPASQPLYKIPFLHLPGSNTAGTSTLHLTQ